MSEGSSAKVSFTVAYNGYEVWAVTETVTVRKEKFPPDKSMHA